MTSANEDAIRRWGAISRADIEAYDDEGDSAKRYLLNPVVLRMLGDLPGRRVLDAGCGQGYLSRLLAARGASVVAIDIDQALQEKILFLALSLDGKLAAGHWTVVGRRPVSEGIPLPAVKVAVGLGGQFDVVDYSGQRRRLASETEAQLLPTRKTFAPAILEEALRAKHGLEPWDEYLDQLSPNESVTTARLFGESPTESTQPEQTSNDDPDSEHSVFVYFTLEGQDYGTLEQREAVYQAQRILEAELEKTGVGEIDGNEFGGGQAALFAYGADADALRGHGATATDGAAAPGSRPTPLRRPGQAQNPDRSLRSSNHGRP
jgi:SAM-dependent methyltransferase